MSAEQDIAICRRYFPGAVWRIKQDGSDPKRPWKSYSGRFPVTLGHIDVYGDNTKFTTECYWEGELFASSGNMPTLEQALKSVKTTMAIRRKELDEVLGG